MFIKLTRTDGRPIWINPEFVVTVEDRKGGGAIVVPAGDGLDYDVRESPDAVMRMCGGVAAVTPPAAEQPSAESADQPAEEIPGQAAEEPTEALPMQDAPDVSVAQAEATVQALREKVKRLRKTTGAKKGESAGGNAPAEGQEVPSGAPPAEQVRQKPPAEEAKQKPRKRTSRGKKPAIDLTDEQMARLRKMAPGSRQKLLNTLAHLKVPDAEATAVALIAHKVIEILPDNHVNWLAQ